ncbi:hypothetical protein ACHQM5_024011 [Ranunculus cassubicifolius]
MENETTLSSYPLRAYQHVLTKCSDTSQSTTNHCLQQPHPYQRHTWHLQQVSDALLRRLYIHLYPPSIFACCRINLNNFVSNMQAFQELKQLSTIAFPMILTGLILYGKSLISMVFMGSLGKEILAGGSLSIGFGNITGYSVLFGLSMGMEAISSQAYGAKQWLLLSISLQRTIAILICISVPISFLWLKVEPILVFFGQNPTIASIASTHLIFSLPDLVFHSILNPLKIYLRSQSITKPLMLSSFVALLFHAPINYVLVYKLQLGIRGVAIAGSLTNLNLLVSILLYLYVSPTLTKSWLGWSSLDCFREWRPILTLAIPSCLSVCLEWWWYEFMILCAGLLTHATESVATMGILIQTTSLIYIFPSALAQAVSTRVGNELGANRPDRARTSTGIGLVCAVFIGFLAMLFTILVRKYWGYAFTSDETIISLTAMALPVVGLCELGNCPQTTGCGVLRGSARPSVGAVINLVSFYGVGLPLAVIMGIVLKMGLQGLWLGLLAAQLTCAIVMTFLVSKTDWIAEAQRAKELTGADVEQLQREEETTAPLLSTFEV